jgi:LCP family protein required for cell wall assembly
MRGRPTPAADRLLTAAVITVGVLLVSVAVLLGVRAAMYRPGVSTATPFPETGSEPESVISSPVRQKERYTVLVAGVDRTARLTDTMMLVNVSSDGSLAVVQLPRDTYVTYRGRDCKLNGIYAEDGIEGLRSVVEAGLCVSVDYYAVIGTEAFRFAVDAVGGVEIDVPEDMDYEDPEQDLYIHIRAGRQLLDGAAAEGFVRFRSGYARGDLDRIDAQKSFMSALLRKLVRETGPVDAGNAAVKVLSMTESDMTARELLWFTELVLGSGGGDGPRLTMMTMPGRAVYSEALGSSFYVIGREAALETVNTWLNDFGVPVPDGLFDPGRVFLRSGDGDFERIYTYSIIAPEPVEG